MAPRNQNKGESSTQFDKFKQAARELECDDDEKSFDDKLRKMGYKNTPTEADKGKDDGREVS